MAITMTQTPTWAGSTERGKKDNGLLSLAAFKKPVWDDILTYTANRWYLQTFFAKFCKKKAPIASNEWSWSEFGKFYRKNIIADDTKVTLISGGTYDLEFTDTLPFLVELDVVDLGIANPDADGTNVQARVDEVKTLNSNPAVRVTIIDPDGTIAPQIDATATHWKTNHEITLLFPAMGECFAVPTGRQTAPDKFSNYLTKIVNTFQYCDDADNQEVWFKNTVTGAYYHTPEAEKIEQIRHRMMVDNALLYSQKNQFLTGTLETTTTEGIIPTLSRRGMIRKGTGAIVEGDIQSLLQDLGVYGNGSEYHAFMGNQMFADAHKALASYFTGGSVMIVKDGKLMKGEKNGANVGINVSTYVFGNRSLNIYEYAGFGDTDFLPANTNATAYSNFGVVLSDVKNSIGVVYKKQRKSDRAIKDFVFTRKGPGMDAGGEFAADTACREIVYETHIGVELKGAQQHALLISD